MSSVNEVSMTGDTSMSLDSNNNPATSVNNINSTAANSTSNSSADGFDIDAIISKLLEVRGKKPGKAVNLTESEIRNLCNKSREIFSSQPILLELEAPIKIVGDIHGKIIILDIALIAPIYVAAISFSNLLIDLVFVFL
jgi:hypothetical protein